MANEFTLTIQGTIANGFFNDTIPALTIQDDQAAIGCHAPIVSVGTSEQDLSAGDVTALGWLYLRNLDPTNYVTYGPKSGGSMVPFGRIKPGKFAILRLEPGITLRWQANTGAVKVQVKLFEN